MVTNIELFAIRLLMKLAMLSCNEKQRGFRLHICFISAADSNDIRPQKPQGIREYYPESLFTLFFSRIRFYKG